MIETIILALIASKIKGYNLKLLLKEKAIYPIIAFEMFYIALEIMVFCGNYSFVKYASIFKIIYLYMFIILIVKYKIYISGIIGSVFIFIGSFMNKIAISANGGKMPVFPTVSYFTGYASLDGFVKVNDIHILGDLNVKFKLLTDIIDVGYSIMSIGDIFIRVFVFIVLYNAIKCINKRAVVF